MTQIPNDVSELNLTQRWAYERTQMSAVRTYFSLLRTGLAIAGGGTLVVSLLDKSWPAWIVWILSAAFVVMGFMIMLSGLQEYSQIVKKLHVDGEPDSIISTKRLVTMTIALQVVTAVVLVLFLLR